jgi:hypothetical protein
VLLLQPLLHLPTQSQIRCQLRWSRTFGLPVGVGLRRRGPIPDPMSVVGAALCWLLFGFG